MSMDTQAIPASISTMITLPEYAGASEEVVTRPLESLDTPSDPTAGWDKERLEASIRNIQAVLRKMMEMALSDPNRISFRPFVGKWVLFSSDHVEMPEELQCPYRVIHYWGNTLDENRSVLMDINGFMQDYAGRTHDITVSGSKSGYFVRSFPQGYRVHAIKEEGISEFLRSQGKEFKTLEAQALEHQKKFV